MRGRHSPFLVLAVLFLASASGSFAQTCESHPGLTYATYVDRNGVTQPLRLDLTVPAGGGPVPLVIWIHGGGWKSGDRTQVPTYVASLCSRGYAVASLDYRLTTTAIWPAQIQDCKAAVRWLRANAASYNLAPDRFAAWGASAGAHLAALLGTSGGVATSTVGNATVVLEDGREPAGVSSRVQAVVDWYGATDFLHMRFYPSSVGNHDAVTSDESRLMGASIQQVPERVATANPITYVTADDPPFLVMHGTLDKTNPFNQSQLLVDALRAAGVPVTFKAVVNAGHGGSLFSQPAAYQVAWSFLDAVLLGPAPPPVSEPGGGESEPGTGPAVRVTASDPSASEAGADGGSFVISREGSTLESLTVTYDLSGTATNGVDYGPLSGSLTIPAGQASATVSVPVVNDAALETAETVLLTLQPGSGYAVGSPATAGVAVADDDLDPAKPIVSISPADPDSAEPETDTGGFLVWRTGSTVAELTVSLVPAGSAEDGVDYATIPRTVTLPAGADRAMVTVKPLDDWHLEPAETVTLTVVPDPGILLAPYTGTTVSVADDDPPGTPELTSATLSPASVLGTQSATGTVTLDVAAPAGGAVVSLASADVNVATVPASVSVPAGATTVTFTVTTKAVAAATTVTLSATRRGVTKSASLTVREPAVSGLTFTPASLVGGCQTSTGKVTLTAKAPTGGLVVPLSSTHPVAVVPASVTVAAGATSATFPVTAPAVPSVQTGTVTASYGGASKSASLSVRPVGVLSLALTPNPVTGPESVTGTVTLECSAPSGGVAVAVSSGSPALASPSASTLAVPAGASSATFTLATADVSTLSSATIRAAANGTAKSVTLTINP